ncbi:hypothetical protein [Rhizobium leguminosarum]|uniref:hypothetical protein n=1 Tax=Rhizobium leguminosarum TaxID=384 RepID=UPI001AE74323|nr:hypothetical protein [Rhizobium leguminosarum]MBP2442859.1 hypothetical protein [Rhizobium leguminosarum]
MAEPMVSSFEEQNEAWDAYKAAKARADATLEFQDGRAAAKAWCTFFALFAGDTTPTDLAPLRKVVTFPGSKVHSIEGSRRDERRS